MVVYKALNKINGKIYIGKTSCLERRIKEHLLINQTYFQRSVKKHGLSNFIFEPLAWCYSDDHLDFLEKFYIGFFNSKVPNGYNLTDGGEGTSGYNLTIETKRKLSNIKKGKPHCCNHRYNVVEENPRFGDHRTWEDLHGCDKAEKMKEEMSRRVSKDGNPMFGKKHSEKSKQQNREKHLGKPNLGYLRMKQ